MQPAFKNLPPELRDIQERRMIHNVWNAWFAQADECEWNQYKELRWAFAPGQPCSVTRLIRACLDNPYLASQLPQSLRERLQEASLLSA
ncbi:MAG: hypothetical protein IKX21_06260 [Deltaproteobacteria bacterium]|nr:hypothetical protein [Deltaproteobacteria bacterium]